MVDVLRPYYVSPYTSHCTDYISLLVPEKSIMCLDSFSNQCLMHVFWHHLDNTSLFIDYPVDSCKITIIFVSSMLPYSKCHRRGEAFVAETAI